MCIAFKIQCSGDGSLSSSEESVRVRERPNHALLVDKEIVDDVDC